MICVVIFYSFDRLLLHLDIARKNWCNQFLNLGQALISKAFDGFVLFV